MFDRLPSQPPDSESREVGRVHKLHVGFENYKKGILATICRTNTSKTLVSGDNTAALIRAVASACTQVPAVSGTGTNLPPQTRNAGSVGLVGEWFNLQSAGHSQNVIETIQNVRVPATKSL